MAKDFPDTIIIVGAGVFGLSSALVIARRYPLTKITVIDRYTPYSRTLLAISTLLPVSTSSPLSVGGYLKILRRTTGLRNTTTLKDPEESTKTYQASYPLTKLDDPTDTLTRHGAKHP